MLCVSRLSGRPTAASTTAAGAAAVAVQDVIMKKVRGTARVPRTHPGNTRRKLQRYYGWYAFTDPGKAYSSEEGRRLMATMMALPPRAWRFRLMAITCSVFGVRANQAVNLAWDDVEMDAEYRVDDSTVLHGAITFRKGVPGSKK